ncbi:2Fe-2S iron-sulfur cluster-binding protein [uncultured Aquimarina sp.]|uniref:2Fe-2S iron-sulfur cluster-binding protein n=1 Tax=uncultured Aquimarina sp. TaxID=575652 RepID=UPI00260969B3|nr:2Fe-2S iron-sulfur cluster-binding protein [uncultured Aquimarina sp.]
MKVTIIDNNDENYIINFKRFEYHNLMELIVNTYYSEIGACRGIGLCGTCIVEAVSGYVNSDKSRLEAGILSINNVMSEKYRLSCQIQLDEAIDGAIFKVSDNKTM